MELEHLQGQKDTFIKMMNGDLSKIDKVSRILRFASKSEMLIVFDSGLFGYKIANGCVVVDEVATGQIWQIFHFYLEGDSPWKDKRA